MEVLAALADINLSTVMTSSELDGALVVDGATHRLTIGDQGNELTRGAVMGRVTRLTPSRGGIAAARFLDQFQIPRYGAGVINGEQHAHALRGASLRVTQPRVALLRALQDRPHSDTETVIGAVRRDLGAVSHQAVYDGLAALTAAGLVRRIQPAGATARYELRVGDNHHHVVCRVCGSVADVDCAVGEAPCLEAADDHGYLIDEAEVVYWGTCPACRALPVTPHS